MVYLEGFPSGYQDWSVVGKKLSFLKDMGSEMFFILTHLTILSFTKSSVKTTTFFRQYKIHIIEHKGLG